MNWNKMINRLTLIGVLILLIPSWFKPIYALLFWTLTGINFINQGVAKSDEQEKVSVTSIVAGVVIIGASLFRFVR
ncbi:hypothetical protein [Sporosarcina trichiuri]|uniref:hypothetical protein n=1 Tax=Sporosarcina trichiuri TaxID=3056445 RepID=UPI0025B552E1|nr:hypothetical protein [Sporosarcina sp. 0.2-SM1T-5]WJY27330.1 hypothetical protein QWT68_15010 [Sporosarcina sp. 0.2-SM1T-5]